MPGILRATAWFEAAYRLARASRSGLLAAGVAARVCRAPVSAECRFGHSVRRGDLFQVSV